MQEVSHVLQELVGDLQEARSRERSEQRLHERRKDLENLQLRLNKLHETYREWLDKLKAAPNLPEENLKNYSALYSFLLDVKNWQLIHADLEAVKGQEQELREEYAEKLQQVNELFQSCFAGQAGILFDCPGGRGGQVALLPGCDRGC